MVVVSINVALMGARMAQSSLGMMQDLKWGAKQQKERTRWWSVYLRQVRERVGEEKGSCAAAVLFKMVGCARVQWSYAEAP